MRHLLIALFLSISVNVSVANSVKHNSGKEFTAIVVPEKCADSVQYAARELAEYLQKSCKVKLPVVTENTEITYPAIYLGETSFAKLNQVDFSQFIADEFIIKNTDNGLIIGGKDYNGPLLTGFRDPAGEVQVYNSKLKIGMFGSQGTLFGVYRFLENYAGIRWYMPGEIGEVVPPKESIVVDAVDQKSAPAFDYRFIYITTNMEATPELMAYVKHLGLGGKIPVVINHSYSFFAKHQKEHPEYFALVGGQRDFTTLCAQIAVGMPCLTNEDFIRQAVKDIGEFFDKNPQASFFPLVPGDGLTRICECAKCQAMIDKKAPESGKFSNYVWSFTNRVAIELAKTHPDKKIGAAAYEHYLEPPASIDKLPNNVALMICKCRMWFDAEKKKNTRQLIDKWRQKTTTGIYFWDYYLYMRQPWRNFPVFFPDIVQDDLRYLKSINAGGEFIEAVAGKPMECPGSHHLNIYVTAKLYWDPDLDLNKLLDEYYTLFYGPGSVPMKKFWEMSRALWIDKVQTRAKTSYKVLADSVFGNEEMKKLNSYIAEANNLVSPNTVYAKRIKLVADEFALAYKFYQRAKQIKISEVTVERSTASKLYTTRPQRLISKDGDFVNNQGWLSLGYDEQNLYVKIIALEPEMKKLVSKCQQQDEPAAWMDDCIEIFISPDMANRDNGYQMVCSTSGAIFDGQYLDNVPGTNKNWNGNLKSKIKKLEDRYIMEITIPFASVGVKPKTGEKFALNIFRMRRAGELEYSCWSPPFEFLHKTPGRFGIVTLK